MKPGFVFTVVGGGTAGLITALMVKKAYFEKALVRVIKSEKIGIVGVGESSTEHWKEFCNFVGIPLLDAIKRADATFKSGVYFDKWAEEDFMHSLGGVNVNSYCDYFYNFGYNIANNKPFDYFTTPGVINNKIPLEFFSNEEDSPTNQFQFDTHKLNKMLLEECESLGIDVVTDDLVGATFYDNGDIKTLNSATTGYETDFVFDCTGFARLIINKVYKQKWISYSEYLPLNSAITFATGEMEEYNYYTKCTARDAGWNWTIPTQSRTGNGYVYCDGFIGRDEAHAEMESAYGMKLDIGKEFKFDPGRVDKAWVNNCVSVGLSQSFVEPLEATSIGSAIQSVFAFLGHFPSNSKEQYNQCMADIFDNIVDYVQAHYLTKREDTPFWKEVKYNLKLTDGLQSKLDMWKTRLPAGTDFYGRWHMFGPVNYIPILHGLGWFDVDAIKREFESSPLDKCRSNEKEQEIWNLGRSLKMSHRQFLKVVKENVQQWN